MTKRIHIIIMLLGFALGVQSCGSNGSNTKGPENDENADGIDKPPSIGSLQGGEWRLSGFEMRSADVVSMTPVPSDQTFTLTFTDEGSATGMADCKGYGYSYEAKADGSIRFFDPAPQVMMYCGDESRDAELYQGLQTAYAYEMAEGRLRIYHGTTKDRSHALLFTRDAAGSGKPVELVEFALFDPGPSDPFTVAASRIVGDELRLTVQYGGGCAEHEFTLIGPLTLVEEDPTPVTLYLNHRANGDRCKAYITKEITFDLTPLRKRWMEVTGRSTGTMALSIGDLHTNGSTTLSYVVGGAGSDPLGDAPAWLRDTIEEIKSRPVANPPESIHRNTYDGKTVYFRPQICCDIPSTLYDATGRVLCHPDGGFTGRGDGKCADYIDMRESEVLVWKDARR